MISKSQKTGSFLENIERTAEYRATPLSIGTSHYLPLQSSKGKERLHFSVPGLRLWKSNALLPQYLFCALAHRLSPTSPPHLG